MKITPETLLAVQKEVAALECTTEDDIVLLKIEIDGWLSTILHYAVVSTNKKEEVDIRKLRSFDL